MTAPQEVIADARRRPLPDGVTLVRLDGRVAALYLDPGRALVQVEPGGAWLELRITAAWRNRLGNRVWVTLPDGSGRDLYPFVAGERGIAEIGQPDRPYQGTRTVFDADYEGTMSLIAAVLIVVLFPVWLLARLPRCTAAKLLLAQLQWALGTPPGQR